MSCLYSCSSAHHAEMSMCSQAPDPGGVPLHQGQGCVYLCFPGALHSTERYPQDVFGELKETKRSILLQVLTKLLTLGASIIAKTHTPHILMSL